MIRPYPGVETRDLSRLWNSDVFARILGDRITSEASPQADKSMNRGTLRFDLGIKPKFNDPVIPAWKPESSAMDGALIVREDLLLDSRH
uniref:Uncharacterized protein n=1 Tax=Candidatus Kentrum sp. LPFa TaxID=2126335 RepID=A0A450XQS8_9GAMM|nr:MAG: hypothetical protein BECKLPF1236A_GA0070988_101424 [Candidatus Kentron sp. LPFa]VFK31635.1 MAG: hypothetical protein BECKLPF1236C_GA0070990_101445 [Candidatus Kentron sp. LPFa]